MFAKPYERRVMVNICVIVALLSIVSAESSASFSPLQADTIKMDSAIKTPVPKKVVKPGLRTRDGYRLQVMKTRDRLEALAVKAELMERFPAERVYMIYKRPFFRVRLGNFITKSEAEKFRAKYLLHRRQVYTVRDRIIYLWHPHTNNP